MSSREKDARLVRAALGDVKGDLIVANGRLINVYSGEILDRAEIGVIDGRFSYVGPSAAHTRGPRTEIIDARGLYVAPGFIDGHTHIGHFCRPFEYLQAYLPRGTTALMASCDELGSVFGYKGLKWFLDEVRQHPLRVYTLVSMCAPQDPLVCNARGFTQEEVAAALEEPDVLGLGEVVSWLRLIQTDQEILERIARARRARKIVHGHTAGARDTRLAAIAAAGVSSCHEPIRAEEAVERLRLGYWVMLREGTIRQDLEATLRPFVEQQLSTSRLMLVTDSMAPDDAAEKGHMDYVARRAIQLGLPLVQAIQAITLNPATYCGLEREIGGIAPGRRADLVLFEDPREVRVQATLIGGKSVAREGETLFTGNPIAFPEEAFHPLRLKPGIGAGQFRIPCDRPSVRVRVMRLLNLTITAEEVVEMSPRDGALQADPKNDLMKVAVFDRHDASGRIALGFLRGLGARVGAIGTTVNLDENTLLLAGTDDADMALCANALIECGGGIAVVDQKAVLEKFAFPVAGLFCLEPWRSVGEKLARLHRLLRDRGAPFAKPIFALSFLTFVTLPALRITDRGLVRAKERKIVPLIADEPELAG
ncbi:MAG TPA: adenine deaminase C-terminal domain-containing protein [Candidatus Acidoferrales bacterium]|nr:adenine deaminase C-terminal domain-containing protein [Candidatus Acidoferrales bacterium]